MKHLIFVFSLIFSLNINAQGEVNYYALGNTEMNNKNYVKAQEYYTAALNAEPKNWNILCQLAFCLHKQKRLTVADSLYKICVQNDSTNSKPFWYKGMNHIALKQDSLVIICYKKFILIEKTKGGNLIIGYRNVGQAYERMLRKDGLLPWQIDDMVFHLEQIEHIDPSNLEVENIKNFVELVKNQRPANQNGKWILQ